ncbi:DNA-binding MarR family transcriptional regulator [Micromonospora luteifusca]|uniref:DNA-binding MarR family transcriptional regulator n=1 Tax=Micromonospora luteifusca TaxID=709860 RepID=A0ABS2LMH9_9ACTN|nr:MarR family transcriptional regulator [Micromonospora luteifusca]MBM7489391.1 DNA-binding MarR family transcriptional regulator [Micromonospora luteifusca]
MRTAEQLRYLILAAQREGNRQLTVRLSEIGVTPAQSEALRIIGDHGPLALRELGDMLVCDTGTSPSRIVDRLVAAGLVERTTSEHDRRQVRLTLTRQGRDKALRVVEIENQLYELLDHASAGTDIGAFIRFLDGFTRQSPAGLALANRLAAEKKQPE